jgi:hypothetical protein
VLIPLIAVSSDNEGTTFINMNEIVMATNAGKDSVTLHFSNGQSRTYAGLEARYIMNRLAEQTTSSEEPSMEKQSAQLSRTA